MDEAERLMLEADRTRRFVEANSKNCRRCKEQAVLNKLHYCQECERKRQESMPPETTDGPEKPKLGESIEACNARLARNKEKLDGARKVLTQVTPQQLLRGDSGRPQVTGTALNHATAAVSLRASIA